MKKPNGSSKEGRVIAWTIKSPLGGKHWVLQLSLGLLMSGFLKRTANPNRITNPFFGVDGVWLHPIRFCL